MAVRTISRFPSADVKTNGTFVFAFPAGLSSADFCGTFRLWVSAHQAFYTTLANQISVDNDVVLTVTYKGATTIPAFSECVIEGELLEDTPGGTQLLYGSGAPSPSLGSNGDSYIDTSVHKLYGPKTAGAWGTGVSLIGPSGSGTGDMVAANNLNDVVDKAAGRSNMGLGSIATQSSSNVSITGGSIAAPATLTGLHTKILNTPADGVTDALAALDAAIASFVGLTHRPTLYIPPGKYHLSGQWEITEPCIIHAHGAIFDNTVVLGEQGIRVNGLSVESAPYNGFQVWKLQDGGGLVDCSARNCGGFGLQMGGQASGAVAIGNITRFFSGGKRNATPTQLRTSAYWGNGGILSISAGPGGLCSFTRSGGATNDLGHITNGGSGYTNGSHIVFATGGSGNSAILLITVAGGVVTAARPIHGGHLYVKGESIGITGSIDNHGVNNIGSGSGFAYTTGDINTTGSFCNAVKFHDFIGRGCTDVGFVSHGQTQVNYNEFLGFQFEANRTRNKPLIWGEFSACNFSGHVVSIDFWENDGLNGDTNNTTKLVDMTGFSGRNKILGDRWGHFFFGNANTTRKDIISLGGNDVGDPNAYMGTVFGLNVTFVPSYFNQLVVDSLSNTKSTTITAGALAWGASGAERTIVDSSTQVYLKYPVITAAAGATISAAATGTIYRNFGATARSDFTLPSADAGLCYGFISSDTDGLRVIAQTGETISVGSTTSATGGRIDSANLRDFVWLVGTGGRWVAMSATGTWTVT